MRGPTLSKISNCSTYRGLNLLRISSTRGTIRFENCEKLRSRYVGPFDILKRIGVIAYRLTLPTTLRRVHDTRINIFFYKQLFWKDIVVPEVQQQMVLVKVQRFMMEEFGLE